MGDNDDEGGMTQRATAMAAFGLAAKSIDDTADQVAPGNMTPRQLAMQRLNKQVLLLR